MIKRALARATDTKACRIGDGVLNDTVAYLREFFPGASRVIVVEDPRTRAAAGERVAEMLRAAGVEVVEHVLEPGGKTFHADYRYVDEVREAIKAAEAGNGERIPRAKRVAEGDALAGVGTGNGRIVPVAVGSGVVNDLTKRAAGELGLPYLTVGTAASVDGYSSFGAALRSPEGAKQTYPCPAPRAIVADLDVMRTAPKWMAASGFADLMAKVPAGADWILAYELGASEWHDSAWHTVQDGLKEAIGDPEGVDRKSVV